MRIRWAVPLIFLLVLASALAFFALRRDAPSLLDEFVVFESVSQKRAARAVLEHVARWPGEPLAGAHLLFYPAPLVACSRAERTRCVVLTLEDISLAAATSKASQLAARLERDPPKSDATASGNQVFIVPIARHAGYTGSATPDGLHGFSQAAPIVVPIK
jgi:hypothetical protein